MSGDSDENLIDPIDFLTIDVTGTELNEFLSGDLHEALGDRPSSSEMIRSFERPGFDVGLVRFDLSDVTGTVGGIRDDFIVSLRGYRVSGDPQVHFTVVSMSQWGECCQTLEAVGTVRWTERHGVRIDGFQSMLRFEKSDPYVDPRDPYIMAVAMAVMLVRRRLSETEAGR